MNIAQQILNAIEAVEIDDAFCREQLANTCPGESPWSREQGKRMEARVEIRDSLIRENMETIKNALKSLFPET